MKTHLFVFVLLCTVFVELVCADGPVHFRDSMLKKAVEAELGIKDPTASDMLELTRFSCTNTVNDGVTSVSGLEYAKNLEYLKLAYNEISSISSLSSLKNLTDLIINDNCISSLSSLSGLKKLVKLDVHANELSSLSGLSGLTNLEILVARDNQIDSISALSGCTDLYKLRLQGNDITGISALSGLKKLEDLSLNDNDISSVSALSSLNKLSGLHLSENDISNVSPLTSLTNLDVLTLSDNPLGDGAYCSDLRRIEKNNPGITLKYSANDDETPRVSATNGTFPDKIHITWGDVCTGPNYDSYFQVLRSTGNGGDKTPISDWIAEQSFDDRTAELNVSYTYWVQRATSSSGSSTSDLSDPSIGRLSGRVALTVDSLVGGSVVTPGQGLYQHDPETVIAVMARVTTPNSHFFTGWKGTAVDKGFVADPDRLSTTVTMRSSCTLTATFATNHNRLYVAHQAGNAIKDGTYFRPFDSIQQAIDAAENGMTVIVRPGVYSEVIRFNGKQITVSGINPDDPTAIESYAVIDGNDTGTLVSFVDNETFQSVLSGFMLTRGNGAIYCSGSSPTITNCLIVGNPGPDYGTVECLNSGAVISNCTIANNKRSGLKLVESDVQLTNSILWDNVTVDLRMNAGSLCTSRYCNFSNPFDEYPTNFSLAPHFADPGTWQQGVWIAGDYHLSSKAGRWAPQTKQ